MPDWVRKLLGLRTKRDIEAEQKVIEEQRRLRDEFRRSRLARLSKSQVGSMAQQCGIHRAPVDGRIRGMQANFVITDDVAVNSSLSRHDDSSKNERTSSPSSSSYCESNYDGGLHSASHRSDSSSTSYDFSSSCSDSSSSYSSCDSGSSSYSCD
jgi:hypothetical protein